MKELKPLFHVEFLERNYKHFYRIRGEDKLYPSVTAFLDMVGGNKSRALQGWARNTASDYIGNALREKIGTQVSLTEEFINEIVEAGKKQPKFSLEASANIGSKCHQALDDFIVTHKKPEMDDQTKHLFNNFLMWLKEHKMKFALPDTSVIYKGEKGFEFGGRFDAVVEDEKGRLMLVDFKSSNHIIEDYALQLSFYFLAFKYTYGVELDGGMIVRFDKVQPIFEVREITKEKMMDNVDICKSLVTLKNGFDRGVWD